MAKRSSDDARLLELVREGRAAFEVLESLARRGVEAPAAGDLLWKALRAGALEATWREGLFSWRSPYLEAMAHASGGFDAGDLAALFEHIVLAFEEATARPLVSHHDRALDGNIDALIAACQGDKAALAEAYASLTGPARAMIGSSLSRAGLLHPTGDERDALLRRAAECVLIGGDTSILATVSDEERARLVVLAASRRDDERRYLESHVVPYLPHATEDELVAMGVRAWGERRIYDTLAARGEAALPAVEREAERLLDAPPERDDDWMVAVVALLAEGKRPFPDRMRPLLDRALTLSRGTRPGAVGQTLQRENPFYAFAKIAPLLPRGELVPLALRSYPMRVLDAIAIFEPLGDAMIAPLRAEAHAWLKRREKPREAMGVILLGLGRLLLSRGEALDAELDPMVRAMLVHANDFVSNDVRAKTLCYDPSRDAPEVKDARRLLGDILSALPIARREALILHADEAPWYFYGVCPTPRVAAHAVMRAAAIDAEDRSGVRDRLIAAALRSFGRAAQTALIEALDESPKLPARAPLLAALADLGAPEALPILAQHLSDMPAAAVDASARRGVAAIDAGARRAFAEEALGDRDRARRVAGALVLETLPPSSDVVEIAQKRLARERAGAVREVLSRVVERGAGDAEPDAVSEDGAAPVRALLDEMTEIEEPHGVPGEVVLYSSEVEKRRARVDRDLAALPASHDRERLLLGTAWIRARLSMRASPRAVESWARIVAASPSHDLAISLAAPVIANLPDDRATDATRILDPILGARLAHAVAELAAKRPSGGAALYAYLAGHPGGTVVEALALGLDHGTKSARDACVDALARASDDVYPRVAAALASKRADTRAAAAAVLSRRPDARAVANLAAALDKEASTRVRASLEAALSACSAMSDPSSSLAKARSRASS